MVLSVGVGTGCLNSFSPVCHFVFFLLLSGRRPDIDCNTASEGLEIQNNQPTNHHITFTLNTKGTNV